MLKKILLVNFLFYSFLFSGDIKIAIASNIIYVIDDLKQEFNKIYPNIKIKVTIGSSGKLTAQIKNGAPYQIFMSANMLYPNILYRDKIALTKPIIYAQGTIALLSNKMKNLSNGLNILKNKDISRIAVGNPKTAPYGKAGVNALKNSKIYKDIKRKLIYGESISQTVSYTVTVTDIGIVAKSSLYSPKMAKFKEGINWVEIDKRYYKPINQGLVILKEGKNNIEVEKFYNFILSKKAQNIFKKFGYIIP